MKRLAALTLAVVVGACASPPETASAPAEPSSVPVATSSPLVEPCGSVAEIQSLLDIFVHAANAGDEAAIAAAVSSSAQWFSITTPDGHKVAYGHDEIVKRLLGMYAAGDRFVTTPTPDQLTLEGWDGAGHFGLATFMFEHDGNTMRLIGKGAVYCGGTARGVEVMSLGGST